MLFLSEVTSSVKSVTSVLLNRCLVFVRFSTGSPGEATNNNYFHILILFLIFIMSESLI